MKKTGEYIAFAGRIVVGFVFVAASIDKIADPEAFANSIINYKIVSGTIPMLLATVLPWLELLCGFALCFGIAVRGSSMLSSAMLFIFTVAVVSAVLRGLDISCGCFTQDPAASKVGWAKVGENTLLFMVSSYVWYRGSKMLSLESFLVRRATRGELPK